MMSFMRSRIWKLSSKISYMTRHYILTRFNLRLWGKDKRGERIDREAWLKRRVELFEAYTLPALAAQTCKGFVWVLLVDSESPEWLRERAKEWKNVCPQIHCVGVKAQYHRYFARVFQEAVNRMIAKDAEGAEELTVLTTYLDNDDAVSDDFVEEIQREAMETASDTFLYYDYGLQYFTEMGISTRVYYPNNHFTTLVERITPTASDRKVKTCYGYGSHFLIEKNRVAKVRHITDKGKPMWVEVIHKGNVDNDVKMTFDTTLWLKDSSCYGCTLTQAKYPRLTYLMRWVPQMIGQVIRRAKGKLSNE